MWTVDSLPADLIVPHATLNLGIRPRRVNSVETTPSYLLNQGKYQSLLR